MESKFDAPQEGDKHDKHAEKHRQKFLKNQVMNNPILQPGYWIPNNINEFFFFDEDGILIIDTEMVKTIFTEYISILKSTFNNLQKKYEDTINDIILDNDLE